MTTEGDPQRTTEASLEAIEQLAAGDQVSPIRSLRIRGTELVERIAGVDVSSEPEAQIEAVRNSLQPFLAIALPLSDFGGQRAQAEVLTSLQRLADLIVEGQDKPTERLLALGLRESVWLLATQALANDRFEQLPGLASIVLVDPYGDGIERVFESSDLRHPDLFERKADLAFMSTRAWLLDSELPSQLPRLSRANDLEAALIEAELLAALCFAGRHGEGFSNAVGSTIAVRRIRARFAVAGPAHFAAMLRVAPGDVAEHINELYGQLTGPDRFRGRGPLITVNSAA